MTTRTAYRTSTSHHPHVWRVGRGWVWACSCGSASCRTTREPTPWKNALIQALVHSASPTP